MNPLFQALVNAKQGQMARPQQQMANGQGQDWNAIMGQLQANPAGMLQNAGYNVPDELSGNPQAMVQHLMQTGQIGGPMMQRIQPFLQRMGIR